MFTRLTTDKQQCATPDHQQRHKPGFLHQTLFSPSDLLLLIKSME